MMKVCKWCNGNLPQISDPSFCVDCIEAFKIGRQHDRPKYTRLKRAEVDSFIDTMNEINASMKFGGSMPEENYLLDLHVEGCRQCRKNPRRLCEEGSKLYVQTLIPKIDSEYKRYFGNIPPTLGAGFELTEDWGGDA